jgi:hypothetical protein
MAALTLLSACGDGGVRTSLSAEDTAVLGAIGQAATMSGTFHLDMASDDQRSSFDVKVDRDNYLLEKYGPAGDSTAPVGELMFLSDGRSFTRTAGGSWSSQDVQLSTSLSGNPGAILASFGALRGFRRDGTETVEGRLTTRYVATASDLKQVLGMMGLGQLSNAKEVATQLGQLLAKFLANARINETVWVDGKGQLARATLTLDNKAGHRPGCTLFPGSLTTAVSAMKVDDSVTVTPPKTTDVSHTSTTDATAGSGATQPGSMAGAMKACFG